MSCCNRILHFEPIAVDFFFYNAEIGDSLVVLGCRGEKDTPEEQTGEKEFSHTIKISFSVVRYFRYRVALSGERFLRLSCFVFNRTDGPGIGNLCPIVAVQVYRAIPTS